MANPVQVVIPSRNATAGVAVVGVASTAAQQSIPWKRGDILIAYNAGVSTRTVTIVNNPANSRNAGPGVTTENITTLQYKVYPRFPAQDNDVLLVTTSHLDVVLFVIGPVAH
jgi:hypothetical protein